MAQTYMNYDANEFSSVWTKVYCCQLSKVRWTWWGADMWLQSRIESFVVKFYVLLDAHLLAID
jgi:hypothetical protein